MKVIVHNHFICHFSCNFSVFSRIILSGNTWCSERSQMTSSDSICKIMLCRFIQSILDLVYHQYGICRMYPKKIHSISVFLFRVFILASEQCCYWVPKLPSNWIVLSLEVSAAYGYSPSGVRPHWMPWTRCAWWTIFRLSVCYSPLHRTQWTSFPYHLRYNVHNNGQCWQYGHRLSCFQIFPFPIQEPFWLWKTASDNPVCIGMKHHTGYESHPSVW